MNSDQLLVCPYDRSHQIRSSRFPYHLVKCRENHPELANMIRVCPFNARHRIPQPEFQRHLLHCEDGKLAAESGTQSIEEDEASSPFVFGQSKFLNGKKMSGR
ncbi:gametocyte-specific factor 1-like isoform X2 [Hemiscyllium ocellatum]|uniref:gametocyte-specific factor 1-like isoform X2 n=1 Tax=Hemiscyllium ocellatum TaxID=170820 RepID=UPI00296766E5|nr:gametocyte-specific factor 1-like isoform X2 [Hemiscyllium ocellatum]